MAAAGSDGEAGKVVGGGEQVEVGVDLSASSHPGSSAAVAPSHEVTELAFHLGPGGAVVVTPLRVLRLGARGREAREANGRNQEQTARHQARDHRKAQECRN